MKEIIKRNIFAMGYPEWRINLRDVCPQAANYIDDSESSDQRYRDWIIAQNSVIENLDTNTRKLTSETDILRKEIKRLEGIKLHLESCIYERHSDAELPGPF